MGTRVSHQLNGRTIGYFLRVPDGHPLGEGYGGTCWQSLRRLAEGQIGTLTAIDHSAAYLGWSDLVATVRAIMAFERDGARLLQINVADPDPRQNPGDHSDHLTTSRLALDAAADLGCVRRVHFVDDASASARAPRSPSASHLERGSLRHGRHPAGARPHSRLAALLSDLCGSQLFPRRGAGRRLRRIPERSRGRAASAGRSLTQTLCDPGSPPGLCWPAPRGSAFRSPTRPRRKSHALCRGATCPADDARRVGRPLRGFNFV